MKSLTLVPSENKTAPRRPPSWEIQVLSLLAVLYQASEARVRRFEQLNRGLAAEVDRLRDRRGVAA
jgi:hypothetical protein